MDFANVKDFGGIAADADALLNECFQNHEAYVSVRAQQKFLVVGRKGSGKTAIFQKLIREKSFDFFSTGHTFDDYPWHHHDLQAQQGVPEESRYVHSWKFLILMTASKLLLNQDMSQPWDESAVAPISHLEDFVVDSYGSRDPDLSSLFSPEKELRFKPSLDLGVVSVEGERIRVRELPAQIQEVNRQIQEKVLAGLNPEFEYFICFDELDRGFSATDEKYAQRLTGLILAARDLHRAAAEAGKKLMVVVFLRDDIYRLLQWEDKNKLTETSLALVEWDGQVDAELTLKRLMERRFGQVFNGAGSVPWDDVFDEDNEMSGRQSKYTHICQRTFLRPRDMIKFCNEILDAHRRSGGGEQFVNADVIGARDAYSDYLLRELDDEIAKHVPTYRLYLEVLQSIGREVFSPDQFRVAWAARPKLQHENPDDALQSLFEFSVIGFLKTGGGAGGSGYVWRYLDPRPHIVLPPDSEKLKVHAGFKECLDLVKGAGRDAPAVSIQTESSPYNLE